MRKLKKTYAERRATMATALEMHGLVDSSAARFGGTSFWIKGPEWLDSDILADELRDKSILIEAGTPFFSSENESKNYFRIAYSSIENDKIAEGIARIAETIRAIN